MPVVLGHQSTGLFAQALGLAGRTMRSSNGALRLRGLRTMSMSSWALRLRRVRAAHAGQLV